MVRSYEVHWYFPEKYHSPNIVTVNFFDVIICLEFGSHKIIVLNMKIFQNVHEQICRFRSLSVSNNHKQKQLMFHWRTICDYETNAASDTAIGLDSTTSPLQLNCTTNDVYTWLGTFIVTFQYNTYVADYDDCVSCQCVRKLSMCECVCVYTSWPVYYMAPIYVLYTNVDRRQIELQRDVFVCLCCCIVANLYYMDIHYDACNSDAC